MIKEHHEYLPYFSFEKFCYIQKKVYHLTWFLKKIQYMQRLVSRRFGTSVLSVWGIGVLAESAETEGHFELSTACYEEKVIIGTFSVKQTPTEITQVFTSMLCFGNKIYVSGFVLVRKYRLFLFNQHLQEKNERKTKNSTNHTKSWWKKSINFSSFNSFWRTWVQLEIIKNSMNLHRD